MLTTARKARKPNDALPQRMSEDEFAAWAMADETHRAEWKNGEVIHMMAENFDHSDLAAWLGMILRHLTEEYDLGRVIARDFMVRLATQKSRRMPDVLFISKERESLLKTNHFEGPPDLAIEVVSPDSDSRDWRDKYLEYEKAGVREYWVIDPMSQRAEAYALKSRKYVRLPEEKGVIRSTVLPKFFIKTDWLWKRPLPNVLKVIRELGIKP